MRIIVACEFSGVVREAFRARGHDAWSCDLLPAEDGSEYHIQGDCVPLACSDNYYGGSNRWDLMIAHPPCTAICCTGNRTYTGTQARLDGIRFVEALWDAPIKRIAIENPVGVLSTMSRLGKPAQYIQPYQFGHAESKKTGLWLKNLPLLEPTKIVQPVWHKNPDGTDYRDSSNKRYSPTHYNPGAASERWKVRSRTYQGIAEAMAEQWGNL